MAHALPQEALRVVQDAVPIHQAVRCEHARAASLGGVRAEGLSACGSGYHQSWPSAAGRHGVDGATALVRKVGMEMDVLVVRCRMGEGYLHESDEEE